MRFAFTTQTPGRRVGGACVAETTGNQAQLRCNRSTKLGSLSFAAAAGRNTHRFSGAILPAKPLPPGTYTLDITATCAGGDTAKPTTLRFTIVR